MKSNGELTRMSKQVARLERFAGLERYEPTTDPAALALEEREKEDLRKKLRMVARLDQVGEADEMLEMLAEAEVI